LPRFGHAVDIAGGYQDQTGKRVAGGRFGGDATMVKLKSWFRQRRWRKRHQADIRAFMRFQSERIARRRQAGVFR
jgi:hypothetical protein